MIEFKNPFKKKGNWYKGNLHIHTTNSDGIFTPEEICEIYSKKGYHFISITDHWELTLLENDFNGLLLIPGIEFNIEDFHVLAIGLNEKFKVNEKNYQNLIDEINIRKSLPVIAHPYWSGLTSSDLLRVKNYFIIEVYNNTCEYRWGKGYSSVHWDEILHNRRKMMGISSDDCHSKDDLTGSFVIVKSENLTVQDIIESLKNGYFYSSTGPIIENVEIAEKKIYIKTSPVKFIDFIGYRYTGKRIMVKRGTINEFEYTVKGNELYIRIEITDKYGKKAWLNPAYLTEFIQ